MTGWAIQAENVGLSNPGPPIADELRDAIECMSSGSSKAFLIWLLALLACADRCIGGDHVGFQACQLHVHKALQGLVWLLALLACADRCAATERVGFRSLSGCMPFSHVLIAAS